VTSETKMMEDNRKERSLSREDISKETSKRIERYKSLNFPEQYAMFMGVSQILEMGLKKLLEEKFNYDFDKIEKWTLGKTAKELQKNNLREDFIILLNSVVDYRNYIAHEILANKALMYGAFSHLIPKEHYDKDSRLLHKAIIELEQLVFLFEWTQENNCWD
jgi:hypothetical protein